MRILHLFRAPLGGLFRHVVDLAEAQAARGHEVGLLCDTTPVSEAAEARLAALVPLLGLGLHRLPLRRQPHPADLLALRKVGRLAAALRPDVLHGHGAKGGLLARAGGVFRRGSALRVYTPHGGSLHYRPGHPLHRPFRLIEATLARATDVFTFESRFSADGFVALTGGLGARVRVIPNGLRDDEFHPVTPAADAATFLFLGELRLLKGVDLLIEAMARLHAEGHRATLAIVGQGPDEAAFRAAVAQRGLEGAIRFHGPLPARAAFALGRTLVLPSRAESFPYVVLEAAAARLPLIATRVGGIPEIMGEDASALIPPEDSAALARALVAQTPAPSPALLEMAERLQARALALFRVDAMADAVLDAYAWAAQARLATPGGSALHVLRRPAA